MRTRTAQKAQTRARLLDAAALLVASRGVEGATVDAIASAAGVTTGALYSSFRNKTELLAALVSERNSDLSGVSLATLAQDLGERLAAQLDGSPVDARLLNELLAAAGRDDVLRTAMATQVRESIQALSRRLSDEHVALRLSADETALLLQVLVAGTVSLRQVLGDDLPASLLTRTVGLLRDER